MQSSKDKPTLCEWYQLCRQPAVLMIRHGVVGWVPTCQRCVNRHQLADKYPSRRLPTVAQHA